MSVDKPLLALEIDSRLEETRSASTAVVEACGDVPDAFQLDLAVTEAINNAIEHAYAMQAGHKVRVEVYREAGRVRVDIIDWGRPLDEGTFDNIPDEVPEPDPFDIDSWEESGRGLMIIKTTMDDIQYNSENGENRFSIFKNCP